MSQPNRHVVQPVPEPSRPTPTEVPGAQFRAAARPAQLRLRHFGLLGSFLLLVVVPLGVTAAYLETRAQDQFASQAGFTVRADEGAAATDLLGGLAQIGGGGPGRDADIVYEFITSPELVNRLSQRIDIAAHYSAPFARDPVFALRTDAGMEDLVQHWRRVLRVSFDQATGLIELRVLAFDATTAQRLAQMVIDESQRLVNELNAQARADAMRFAEADLAAAVERLRTARAALSAFRTRTQIVDPVSDLQTRMGVLTNLQQQLAEALINHDILSETTANQGDARLVQATRRIAVIEGRIAQERQTFTRDDVGPGGEDYPTLMAEFEGLTVDREFAEQSYRAALSAVDTARANAARQSRYLAVFVHPTQPDTAQYPRRDSTMALAALFLTLGWAIAALVFYSLRDRQ